jgi:2-keto-4-pentenoate hydratase/2-oxohepta-3-ene-1,7-dioic acid hydratase in catechol pathway
MKFLRFRTQDSKVRQGYREAGKVFEITGEILGEYHSTGNEYNFNDIKFLPPCSPTKIVAVGLNYRNHAEELKKKIPDEPLLFIKPSTSIIGHEDKIIYPHHMSSRVDYEGELGVVIGKEAKWVNESDAVDYIFGYTCVNDVTARDLQVKDVQYTRAKGFDSFAPLGPVIETEIDPSDLEISTFLNGELKQHARTSELIFNVPRLVSFISRVMTLLEGDVISTGTPAGIGPMKNGDKVEIEIQGIGTLRNYVAS